MKTTENIKNIVIAGGSSGIGLALVQKLDAGKKNIVNISRSACPVAGVRNIITDLAVPEEIDAAFSRIDRIDALIYCAGMSLAAPVEYTETADYRKLFEVNFLGAAECVKLAMPMLRASGDGRIILLASSGGVAPIAFDAFYSASKSALMTFAEAINLETENVRATAVVIGGTKTRFSFKRKIYTDCGDYDRDLKAAADSLIKMEQTGYNANRIADGIIKVLVNDAPPPAVTIGFKNKAQLLAYKVMPSCARRAVLRSVYGINK